MPTSDPDIHMSPPPQAIKRFGTGLRVVLQLVFGFLALLSIFYLAISHYDRRDLTRDGAYTLSEATQKLLTGPSLQKREEPVVLIAGIRKSSPHFSRLHPILEEYERLSQGKLEVEFLDPIRDKDRALEIKNNYGDIFADKLFSSDLLIIDARKGNAETEDQKIEAITSHLRYLSVDDLVVERTDENKQRRRVGYQDEDLISSSLHSAIEGRPRVMYLIADKSDIEVGDANSPWRVLTEALLKQNIILMPLNISENESIPTNAEGIVIVAPKYDFETREIEALEEYWNRPSSSIMAYLDPTSRPVNLRAFFRKHGVSPRNDRIIRTRNGRTETQVLATFTSGTEVNSSLEGKSVPFEGRIGSLEVREGAEDLVSKGIQCFSLIESVAGFWGETDYKTANPAYNDDADEAGPLSLAAAVIKGNARADATAENISKMIVLSTSDFLDPKSLGNEQLDFVKNSTFWLLGREELMGIGPRSLEMRRLNLIKSEVSLLTQIAIFFIPAGLLLISLMVWNSRRA